MQSSLCRRVLKPSAVALRQGLAGTTLIRGRRSAFRRDFQTRGVLHSDSAKYPELEDILGKPAATFEQLIDQLETLIKHPNPPRNYADALAKEELRRQDIRDLTPELTKGGADPARKMLLRQRPRLLRHAQPEADQSIATEEEGAEGKGGHRRQDLNSSLPENRQSAESDIEHLLGSSSKADGSGALEVPPLPEDVAINLGFTSEQQERRRIWLTKVAGYRAFRNKLLSVDSLLDNLDDKRSAEDRAPRDQMNGSSLEKLGADAIGGATLLEDDREFERLIRKSWKLRDEDVEAAAESSKTSAKEPSNTEMPGSTQESWKSKRPPGKRSYHTSRILPDAAGSPKPTPIENPFTSPRKPWPPKKGSRLAKKSRLPEEPGEERRINKKIALSKPISPAPKLPKSLVRNADMPTAKEIRKHISQSKESTGEIHVPIDATVNTGDIVELRQMVSPATSSQFTAAIMTGGVIQKTTGRFHINAVMSNGSIMGAREQRVGFVARGLLFDEALMRASGVDGADVARVLEYAEELREYEATHGHHALVPAYEAELLQQLQNQSQTQSTFRGDFEEAADVAAADAHGLDSPTHQRLSAVNGNGASMINNEATATDGQAQGDAEETITEVMLRTIPRVLRVFQQRAEQLMRSHYRELGEYWNMALKRGQRRVTVDALAELIFGSEGGEPVGQEARYAAYMHLIGNPLHFIPDTDGLFVTNTFELRCKKDVYEIESVRGLIREDAPEFRKFIETAKKLVAYSHEHSPMSPLRVALDPDLKSAKETTACRLTGWDAHLELTNRRPQPAHVPTEKDVSEIQFDKTDFSFINVLRSYVFHHNTGYRHFENPYESLVSPIIKKMHYYSGCDVINVTRFLVDIGVWPHWFNPKLNTRNLPFGTLGTNKDVYTLRNGAYSSAAYYLSKSPDGREQEAAGTSADADKQPNGRASDAETATTATKSGAAHDPSIDPARIHDKSLPVRVSKTFVASAKEIAPKVRASILTKPTGGVGIIDKTRYYDRDVCEDIRHDFGNLPVYTIDDSATRDVDDGVSVETIKGADGKDQTWLHMHIADPTALIHPGHIATHSAETQMSTLYYVEKIQHMLPLSLTLSHFSLVRRGDGEPVKTMTFSALIGEDGDIVDYKVRPGVVRNIVAMPYESVDQCLSYEWSSEKINSLEKIKDVHRHSTIIHPFVPTTADFKRYGETYGAPDEDATRQLRDIQEIARRHYAMRVRSGGFNRLSAGRGLSLLSSTPIEPSFNIAVPKFALPLFSRPEYDPLVYPGIRSTFGISECSPAHAMVGEVMIVAGRVGARFANEHGPGAAGGLGINGSGVVTSAGAGGNTGVPILYRAQEPPKLDSLSGAALGMPLALEELSTEEAKSARAVWNAVVARAQKNDGYIDNRVYDEVRHMLNPSVFTPTPTVHTIMGINDRYGYARVSSPIRRFDDLVSHWQLKAQLLAEHGDARDKSPWYWKHDDMELLAPVVFRRSLLSDQCMKLSEDFWSLTLMRRMEHEARRGKLLLPPEGFYDPNSPAYYDLPWPYYDPRKPGPLTWTATVDNRDESRTFISLIIDCIGTRAMLIPRPVDATVLPFAGTKIRVQVLAVDPAEGMLIVKLAPEEYQPPETPKFWRNPPALNNLMDKFPITRNPPERMQEDKSA
ncbi:RNB-domain-containing protein [Martensiomyces pterosporus]|nr:RNB-domain-containing protein [Martensiomyces pterosporus]